MLAQSHPRRRHHSHCHVPRAPRQPSKVGDGVHERLREGAISLPLSAPLRPSPPFSGLLWPSHLTLCTHILEKAVTSLHTHIFTPISSHPTLYTYVFEQDAPPPLHASLLFTPPLQDAQGTWRMVLHQAGPVMVGE